MDRSTHQPTNVPNANNVSHRDSIPAMKPPTSSTPADLEKGPSMQPIDKIELN